MLNKKEETCDNNLSEFLLKTVLEPITQLKSFDFMYLINLSISETLCSPSASNVKTYL